MTKNKNNKIKTQNPRNEKFLPLNNTNGCKRSDYIAIGAVLISFIPIIISIVNIKIQYGESVVIDLCPIQNRFLHVDTVVKQKGSSCYIKKLSSWHKLRLINKSNSSLTITTLSACEDNDTSFTIPTPFFSSVNYNYNENEVFLGDKIFLPLRIEAKDAVELFVLLPFSVSRKLGEELVTLMYDPQKDPKRFENLILFSENAFEQYESSIFKYLKNSKLGSIITFQNFFIPDFIVSRNLIFNNNGIIEFRDFKSPSTDGWKFRNFTNLICDVHDRIILNKNITAAILAVPYQSYTITCLTSSGKNYTLAISSKTINPFVIGN